ncbi:MAG: CHAT domain-containing protein [Rhodanobacteraceae bacterium]|nr:CHAT domain-containing protein [Rhodanobacteraceae bacterium]
MARQVGSNTPGWEWAARLLRGSAVLAAGLLAEASAACAPVVPYSLPLAPGNTVSLQVAADAPVLLEEMGADVEYRRGSETAFATINAPPSRLGFAVVAPGAAQLELRIKSGQGGGRVWVSDCINTGDVLFWSHLAELHTTYLRAGSEAGRTARLRIEPLQWLPLDPFKRSRVASAQANALLSAGLLAESGAAFAQARTLWLAAGRPDHAAVSLLAQGENASRTGHFAEAEALLARANEELLREGVTYYALRSQAALCTVLSRRGDFAASVACEQRVLAAMQQAGEEIEAATRQVSLSNQYMRLDEFARARELLLAADRTAAQMSPIVRSRLESAWGSYHLYRADLPAAAARFAQAALVLAGQGLPTDQALIDLKLASLAALSGALDERRRLLERALARLDAKEAPPLRADSQLQLARALRDLGEAQSANTLALAARDTCRSTGNRECSTAARLIEAQALMDLGKLDLAAAALAQAPDSDAALTRLDFALAAARLQLAYGRPELALQQLPGELAAADDLALQVQYARLKAASHAALGDRAGALASVREVFERQLGQAESWPSAALRISARNRLAELQATLLGLLLVPGTESLDLAGFEQIAAVIEQGSVQHLFRRPSAAALDAPLRRVLSAAVLGATSDKQRELFAALARTPSAAAVLAPALANPSAGEALDESDAVVVPLQSEHEFLLLVRRADVVRVCRRWPLQQYRELVARFGRVLDGEPGDFSALEAAAADWHAALKDCHPGLPAARHWHIASLPGTRALPWAWIAAAGADAASEPLVSTTFRIPRRRIDTLPRPALVTLLDLNMPQVESLPFATRERAALEKLLGAKGIAQRRVMGADDTPQGVLAVLSRSEVVHVIGHANPPAYGQLYQGLWFESERRPSLLTYPEIVASPSQAELVVLSACGAGVAAEAAFGAASRLAEAFIAAGARRVVAASNALSDAAAPTWAQTFHDSLWKSGDVAAAARDARRVLRQSPHFRHPKFWAGIEVYLSDPPHR